MFYALVAHLRAQWMGALALFLVLTGGVAYAANTVFTADIVDNEVYSVDVRDDSLAGGGLAAADLRAGSVRSSEIAGDQVLSGDVRDDSLTGGGLGAADLRPGSVGASEVTDGALGGADIQESALAQVPSALLGGFGRSFGGGACNPGSATYIDCGYLTLALPSAARVLMVAAATGYTTSGSVAYGNCRLVTNIGGVIPGSDVAAAASPQSDGIGFTTITGPFGPGSVDFGVECQQDLGDIAFSHVQLSVVALSPD